MEETKRCPWCAEEILAAARKCKHCGEFLEPASQPAQSAAVLPPPNLPEVSDTGNPSTPCPLCGQGFATEYLTVVHLKKVHSLFQRAPFTCVACSLVFSSTARLAEHEKEKHPYSGKIGSRKPISEVGDRSEDGALRCPTCGGTQFTAKRSNKGKATGLQTIGVGSLIAPKSQVKCVTCGTMFKRG